MLGLDHHVVSCADNFALGKADRVPLDDLFDVRLRQLGVRGEGAAEGVGMARQGARARSKGEHGADEIARSLETAQLGVKRRKKRRRRAQRGLEGSSEYRQPKKACKKSLYAADELLEQSLP